MKSFAFNLLLCLMLLSHSVTAFASSLNGEYTVDSNVQKLGSHSYKFTYNVTNNNQGVSGQTERGLDGFAIMVPKSAVISNISLPSSYAPGGQWISKIEDSSDVSFGYNWLSMWGATGASVYPIGSTATFSFRADNIDVALNTAKLTIISPVSISSKAKVFLNGGGGDDYYIAAINNLTIYGGSGDDAISILSGVSGVVLDQNIERINLPSSVSTYTFKQTGNKINAYDSTGETLILTVPVQGDSDGTLLGFSDGTASVILSGTVMTLGGKTVSTSTPTTLAPTLQK